MGSEGPIAVSLAPDDPTMFNDFEEPVGLDKVEKEARSRTVYVETRKDFGSGFIPFTNMVITTAHLLLKDDKKTLQKNIKVNGRRATVVHMNKKQDLAALTVDTEHVGPVTFARTRVGQEVLFVGHNRRVRGLPARGTVTYSDPKAICASMMTAGGTCGTALWNVEGVCGIVASEGDVPFTLATPARILEKFVAIASRKLYEPKTKKEERKPVVLPFARIQGRFTWG